MKRYCLALDLKDDAELIRDYEEYRNYKYADIPLRNQVVYDNGSG
jgi:hypothetical protein